MAIQVRLTAFKDFGAVALPNWLEMTCCQCQERACDEGGSCMFSLRRIEARTKTHFALSLFGECCFCGHDGHPLVNKEIARRLTKETLIFVLPADIDRGKIRCQYCQRTLEGENHLAITAVPSNGIFLAKLVFICSCGCSRNEAQI